MEDMFMKENTCCFFGHRTINKTEELKNQLIDIIKKRVEKGLKEEKKEA